MSDKMREEFEAWYFSQRFEAGSDRWRYDTRYPFEGGYEDANTEKTWQAWQAAYAAGRAAGMEEAAALCDAVNRDRERAMAEAIREAAK